MGGLGGPIVAPHLISYTAAMAPISIVIVVLAAVLGLGEAFGGPSVRVPRDSAIVVNGVIRPPTGSVTAPATVEPPATPASRAAACTRPIVPDPGYRPMWVPGDWCWTGGAAVWVPGHWVW